MATIQINETGAAGTIEDMARVVVYTKAKWSDDWTRARYLWPLRIVDVGGPGVGYASLVFEAGRITQPDLTTWHEYPKLADLSGAFVKICRLAGERPDLGWEWATEFETLWIGVIDIQNLAYHGADASDEACNQTVTAFDLKYLLAGRRLDHAWVCPKTGAEPVRVEWAPPFNQRMRRALPVQGNAVNLGGTVGHVFGRETDDETEALRRWTNADVLQYVLYRFAPRMDPDDDASDLLFYPGGQCALLDNIVEPHDFSGRSVLQIVQRLIDPRRGLGWRVVTDGDAGSTITIEVYSMLPETLTAGGITLERNIRPVSLDVRQDPFAGHAAVTYSRSNAFQTVRVQGNRVLVCCSLSIADGTLEAGWTGTLEAAYKTAAGSSDEAENDRYRGRDQFEHVYSRLAVPAGWDWQAGDGVGGDKINVNIYTDDAGDAITLVPLPAFDEFTAFERGLPLWEGYDYTEWPAVNENPAGAEPYLRRPLVVVKAPNADGDDVWHLADRLSASVDELGKRYPNAGVTMLDGRLCLSVRFTPRHVAALNHWTIEGEDDPAYTRWPPMVDYADFIATVALRGNARLAVVVETGFYCRGRVLTIDVPDADLWWVVAGTVIDVDSGGDLVRMDASRVLHTDADRLKRIAMLAKAYYRRPRYTASLVLRRIDQGLAVGHLLHTLEGEDGAGLDSVITRRVFDFIEGTTTIETANAELDWRSLVADQAGAGLAGVTLARTVGVQGHRLDALERRTANLPDRIPPQTPRDPPGLEFGTVQTRHTNTGTPWGSFEGDGFIEWISVYPCSSNGDGVDEDTTLTIKCTQKAEDTTEAKVGFAHILGGHVIGFVRMDEHETAPGGGPYDGQVVANAGINGAVLSGVEPSHTEIPPCEFGTVLAIKNHADGGWASWEADGWISHVQVDTTYSTGAPVDDSETVWLKAAEDVQAQIGYDTIEVGDVIGFVRGDGWEPKPGGGTFHGYVIPNAGIDGAVLTTYKVRGPILYDPWKYPQVFPALVVTAGDPIEARVWMPTIGAFPVDPSTNHYFLTPAGVTAAVSFDQIGDSGDFTADPATLIPALRDYDAGNNIADWITVRVVPGNWSTEVAVPQGDGHLVDWSGTLIDYPLPYVAFVEVVDPHDTGLWQRAYTGDLYSVTAAQYRCYLIGDIGAGATSFIDYRSRQWFVRFDRPPRAGAIIRVRYVAVSACKWRWVEIAQAIEGGDLEYVRPEGGEDDGWLLIDDDPESDFYGCTVHGDPQTTKLDTTTLGA